MTPKRWEPPLKAHAYARVGLVRVNIDSEVSRAIVFRPPQTPPRFLSPTHLSQSAFFPVPHCAPNHTFTFRESRGSATNHGAHSDFSKIAPVSPFTTHQTWDLSPRQESRRLERRLPNACRLAEERYRTRHRSCTHSQLRGYGGTRGARTDVRQDLDC